MKTLQAMKCCGMMGSHCVLGISFLAGIFQGVRFAQSQGRCLWDLETRWITRSKISTNLFITSELRCRRPIEKTSGSEQRCILGPKIRQCACRSMRKTCWLVRRCFCRNCFFLSTLRKILFIFIPTVLLRSSGCSLGDRRVDCQKLRLFWICFVSQVSQLLENHLSVEKNKRVQFQLTWSKELLGLQSPLGTAQWTPGYIKCAGLDRQDRYQA